MGTPYLKGIRIIALTWVWAGPWMGAVLADMGAEVIKIETNQRLDSQRVVRYAKMPSKGFNHGQFNFTNRGVKSCTLNLKQPEARDIFKKLVKISDVVISNYSPRVMPGWGLDYTALAAIKPDIIFVTLPAFGSTGPDKDYVSYASTIEAVGGLSASFGYPEEGPVLSGTYPGDPIGSMYGVISLLAALNYRDKTGEGQHVEVAQSEGVSTLIPEVIMEYVMNGRIRPRLGNRDESWAPHGCYPCKGKDKWVVIAVTTDDKWNAMCKVMGNPDWSKDEKFSDQYSRWQNQDELNKLIANWTKDFTHYEVMHKLQKAGVAAGGSLDIEELTNDPHVKKRGTFIEQNHPVAGKTIVYRSPWASSLTADNPPAPCLGEHNDYVFKDLLHMSDKDIAGLIDKKVIY
jgi:crotonobetainyl-CoA:carnitine CoA-transferase CaiB-like acyl-CoA transferase